MVDFCQREMVKFNSDLDHETTFLDNVATLGRSVTDDHANDLEEVLNQVEESGLQMSTQKRKWPEQEAKCLE